MVRSVGLEPTRLATHAPQTCLSADSSMTAYNFLNLYALVYHTALTMSMIIPVVYYILA